MAYQIRGGVEKTPSRGGTFLLAPGSLARLDCARRQENLMTYGTVLRNRGFRDLWLGQAVSQFGDALYYVLFLYMVKKITGSDAWVGFVGAAEALPYLLLGPYAGVLADRLDRRQIMLWSDLICGFVLVGFAIVLVLDATPSPFVLLGVAFSLSCFRVFFLPAKSAALPNLVPVEQVHTANSLSMATQNIMPMSGLAFSAGLIAILYDRAPQTFFTLIVIGNAISFFVAAYFAARLPQIKAKQATADRHPLDDVKDGLRYMKQRADLVIYTGLLAMFRLGVAPFFVVYLAANDQWFNGRPINITWWEFSFFVGMIVSSYFVGKWKV